MTQPGSVGVTGLPDGQYTDLHDSGTAIYTVSGAQVGNVVSPVLIGSPYERAHVSFTLTAGQMRLNLSWYNDFALAQFVGQHSVVLDSANAGTLIVNLPHEGPYFQVKVVTLAGGSANWTGNLYVYTTNRQAWAPINPAATGQGFPTGLIAAGATETDPLNFYYMGGVWLRLKAGDQSTTFTFQCIDGADNSYSTYADFTLAAGVTLNQFFFIPADACQVVIQNNGASDFTKKASVGIKIPWQGST